MGKIISADEALKIKESGLVIVGGAYDLLHIGHTRFLTQAKKMGSKLMVWLESDEAIKQEKGKDRPINNQADRAEILGQLLAVDYVVKLPPKGQWNYEEALKTIKPAVVAVSENDKRLLVKKQQAEMVGARLEVVPLIKGKSTTEIINLIKHGRI